LNSHELAKKLLESDPVELLIQKDSEGNGYRPFHGVDFDVFIVKEEREIEVYNTDWTADDCCMVEEEYEEKKRNGKGFAILY
jgi:hypothetical protein